MPKIDKVIVTNMGALRAKYGARLARVRDAISVLVAADAARGLATRLIALDDAAAMKKLRARPVKDAGNCKENKIAIDGVYAAWTPDYLMILGAVDVVPHQDLTNPLYSPADDDDRYAWGDLPYACEAPYGRDPGDFRGPTRVVGRVPDVVGAQDPAFLIRLLRTAMRYRTRPRADYDAYFGLSALVWKKSTELSVQNLFGAADALQTSPKKGPTWPAALLGRRSHFINCHGASDDPFFYGQSGERYPHAHAARLLAGKISEGTILAAECCFGGQLYDPNYTGGQAGICSTYLDNGAYGVFGSSTIAYGPSEGNASADLICQFFLEQVLAGASVGRAALEARQRFVERSTLLDPADLKTLAQFNLLGDPAVHAVEAAHGALTRTKAYRSAFHGVPALPPGRELRRERLMRRGTSLPHTVATVRKKAGGPPRSVQALLAKAARESQISRVRFASFASRPLRNHLPKGTKSVVGGRAEVYVAMGRHKKAPRTDHSQINLSVVLTATVKDGEVVRLRRLHGK